MTDTEMINFVVNFTDLHFKQGHWSQNPLSGSVHLRPVCQSCLKKKKVEASSKLGFRKPVHALEDDWERIRPVDGNRQDKTGQTR